MSHGPFTRVVDITNNVHNTYKGGRIVLPRFGRRRLEQRSRASVEPLELRQLLALAVYFEQVPITPAAIAADPALEGYQAWDLKARVWSVDRFTVSDLIANLASGTFYNVTVGAPEPNGGNGDVSQPRLWPQFPNLEFDTYVTAPLPEVEL